MSTLIKDNDKLIALVQETTANVFGTMLGMTVVPGDPVLETESTVINSGLVTMVGMAGAISGNGCIAVSTKFACLAASSFLMAEYTEVDDDVLDAIAELGNMIIGNLKASLEDQFGPMALSIPTVVFGERYVTRNTSLGERLLVSFDYKTEEIHERFTVQICLLSDSKNRNYMRELADFHAKI